MKTIYCISGLGADASIFSKIDLHNIKLVHLAWPLHDNIDTLQTYAEKLSAMIKEENPIIMGVSFGGMLATEIAKNREVKKVIIVSSAKNNIEKPHIPWLIREIVLCGVVPSFLYKIPNPLIYYLFGVESKTERCVLNNILRNSNGKLAKWSVNAILKWSNDTIPNNLVHIHGKKDRLIKYNNIQANYWIEDGGHMMVYNRAEQISKIIEKEIENT